MIKYVFLIAIPLLANSCTAAHNATYYNLHPLELQEAIEACPEKYPAGVTCEQLNVSATQINVLASELHQDPQGFGRKILELQEHLAKLAVELKQYPNHPELLTSIDSKNTQLAERLAIVKWLESPRG